MDPLISCSPPLMQEDILHHLAPFLDGNTIKSARLVCKLWNFAVEKEIPNRLKLVAFRHGQDQPDPDALSSDTICPLILTYLDFTHCSKELLWIMTKTRIKYKVKFNWPIPEEVQRPYHQEIDFLPFFRNVTLFTAIKSVKVFDGRQLHTVVHALNEGLLPNLQALEVCQMDVDMQEDYFPRRENVEPLQQFKRATITVPLPNLTWLSLETECLYSREGKFYQKLINAASNLHFLDCTAVFDASNLTKLQEFKLNGQASRPGQGVNYYQDKIHERLSPLKDQLLFLGLANIELKTAFLHFPNVRKLELREEIQIKPTVPGTLASYFPSLEKLRIDSLWRNEAFLKRGLPETLKFLEFDEKCLDQDDDSDSDSENGEEQQNPEDPPPSRFLQDLHLLAPKLEFAVCKFYRFEMRQELLNLTFPNLVIQLKREFNFVEVLEAIGKTSFQTTNPENLGGILEIRNGNVPLTMIRVKMGGTLLNVVDDKDETAEMETEQEDQNPIELFVTATKKLLEKFKFIRFFHFKIEEQLIRSLKEVITQRELNVEFFM